MSEWANMARQMAAVVREEIELRARLEALAGKREDLERELIDMVRREQVTQRMELPVSRHDATVILSASMRSEAMEVPEQRTRVLCHDSCCLPGVHTHWADGSITHHAGRLLP